MKSQTKRINVAILGIGVVGKSVIEILQQNKDLIKARSGVEILPKIAVARNISNKNVDIPLSTDIDAVLEDESIDMIVELIGGVELPYKIALKAIQKNKSLVTANKAMLAYHRHELEQKCLEKNRQNRLESEASKNHRDENHITQNLHKRKKPKECQIAFEASVCGGIPIIRILRDGLCANHILSIRGIMNGTSNYILSQMSAKNTSFESALKEAQRLGYAEADPSLDINGSDSAHKLLILASLAYRIDARVEDIIIEGIQGVKLEDIEFARENNYAIKLLGIAKKNEERLSLRVHLCLIPSESMLAKVNGAMNALSIISDKAGESLYYGVGAGGSETASSVVSDIMEIARSKTSPMLGYVSDIYEPQKVRLESKDSIECKYYLRLKVADESGVLAIITTILAQHKISIESLIQRGSAESSSGFQECDSIQSEIKSNQDASRDVGLKKDRRDSKTQSKNMKQSQESNIIESNIVESNILESKKQKCKSLEHKYIYPKHKSALLLLSTHICNEKQIKNALKELKKLKDVLLEEPFMIRHL